MKIVILDGYALNPGDLSYDVLKQFGDLAIYDRTDSEAEAIARIGDGEIVLTNKVPITESLLAACPGIRLVCVMATGYNVVDCAACARRGIPVTNVPGYGTAAVAQFTMALLLELCHRVGLHDRDVHSGGWAKADCFTYWRTPQTELAGKTMGIIGFGAIGKAVGRLARAFGMHVLAYNRSQSEEGRGIAAYVDLDTLLAQSDVSGNGAHHRCRSHFQNEERGDSAQYSPGAAGGGTGPCPGTGGRETPGRGAGCGQYGTHCRRESAAALPKLHHHAPHGLGPGGEPPAAAEYGSGEYPVLSGGNSPERGQFVVEPMQKGRQTGGLWPKTDTQKTSPLICRLADSKIRGLFG